MGGSGSGFTDRSDGVRDWGGGGGSGWIGVLICCVNLEEKMVSAET